MCKRFVLYVCIFIFTVMLGLPTATTCTAAEKDTLIVGIQDDTTSFDPAVSVEDVPLAIMPYLYERLVVYEKNDFTNPVPRLTESWKLGEDGKTWTFHLRKGVSFSNGNPVKADDVVFSLRRLITLETDTAYTITQFGITEETIMKIDEHTVQMVLDRQYAPGSFLASLASSALSILDQKTVMEHETDGDMGSVWLNTHSAGAGPYVIEEREPGKRLVLRANPFYWKGKPVFEKVIVRHIPEPVTQMALLEKGEIDVAWDLSPDQLKRLKNNPDVRIARTQIFKLIHAAMNVAYEPLSKPEIRDAIRYAIDYERIVDIILQGAAVKSQTVIPKGIFGHNPIMPYSRDLGKVKQLLSEAGYPTGFDLELACLDSSPWMDIAIKIKMDLSEAGIRVKVIPMSTDQLFNTVVSRQFQMFLWSWELDYADPDASIKPYAVYDSNLLAWWCNYNNPELAKLSNQATQELDSERRAALYKQITDIILDDGPYAILASPLRQFAVRAEVEHLVGPPPPILSSFPTLR